MSKKASVSLFAAADKIIEQRRLIEKKIDARSWIPRYQPMYDTEIVWPANQRVILNIVPDIQFFTDHLRFNDNSPKTKPDTNMMLDGQLGHPLMADFSYFRLTFLNQDKDRARDIRVVRQAAMVYLVRGASVLVGEYPLSEFFPVVPIDNDGQPLPYDSPIMAQALHQFRSGAWPSWYVPIKRGGKAWRVESAENFRVAMMFGRSDEPDIKKPLRVRASLGPTLYCPREM